MRHRRRAPETAYAGRGAGLSTTCRSTTTASNGGLAGHRSPRLRPAHLDPDAVVIRALRVAGRDAAPAAARHRRAPDPVRAANPATAGPALALGCQGHHRRSALRAFPDAGYQHRPCPDDPERRPRPTAGNNHTPNTIAGERNAARNLKITKDRG